jgi:deoxyribodipyrimidine photolyase-related protein
MKYYYDMLKKNGYKVEYIEYNKKINITDYKIFDPIDKIKLKGKYEMIESPNFILTKNDMKKFNDQRKSNKVIFNNFYLWAKTNKSIYPKLKSLDKMNRKKYTDKKIIPLPKISMTDKYYIDEAIKYINKHFPNNYGNTNNFSYPITHETAMKWLKYFIKYKFKYFGPYEDAVVKNNYYMYHSVLSSSINIGLINPNDIIKEIDKIKTRIPLNSFEGYVRQLFWREYQRYTYTFINFNKNYFGNNKKLNKHWYDGTTGILPIDDMIKSGFDTGYIHHIGRLMYIGNFMNISGIAPKEGFRWFMEFSIDSYEWVMHQNVLDMVFFVTGGTTMTRPYISSSNYILKLSDYKKDNNWNIAWDNLYRQFLKKHKVKLYKFRYYFPGL